MECSCDPETVKALQALGHDISVQTLNGMFAFGGAQMILRTSDGYVGGTDPRKDGLIAAF